MKNKTQQDQTGHLSPSDGQLRSELPDPVPSSQQHFWLRRWGKILLLIVLISIILFAAYFIQTTYTFYQQIEEGTIDLSSFEQGGTSELEESLIVENPSLVYINNYQDDPVFGPQDAPVTIVAFEDFQCPYCRQASDAVHQMVNQFGNDVLFVYRDFPIDELHPNAKKAAEAAQCAHEQGQFFSYHDKLFINQSDLSVTALKQYALELHLDTAAFDNCLDTGKYTQEVQADFEDGLKAGVTGTPTFFFNGNKVAGVITLEGFSQIIDYFKNN